MRLVCGVGVNDGRYPATINKIKLKEYTSWSSMIRRCYSEKQQTVRPTYKGCTVSSNFKSYSYFYEWCQDQIGFHNNEWELDKDILIKGNKVYSEDNCVFLPTQLNTLLLGVDSRRGDLPIGITYKRDKGLYVARIEAQEREFIVALVSA